MTDLDHISLNTPVGPLVIIARGRCVVACDFVRSDGRDAVRPSAQARKVASLPAADAVMAYFAGDFNALASIEVAMHGSAFQQAVWAELRRIPPGMTISYGELARRIGRPTAQRAVGAANGANPIGLIVPCHRVIAANGTLGGYSAGLERKRWLLAHEAKLAPNSLMLKTVAEGADQLAGGC